VHAPADPSQSPGEFELIALLTQHLETREDVVLGAGDDAALLACEQGLHIVATCDAQVEDVHFTRDVMSPEEIGAKALAVNLSDIAAMGATPRWALVSLLVPPHAATHDLLRLYDGLREMANEHSVAIVGGNISSTSGPLAIDITLLGTVPAEMEVRRSGAHAGDVLCVTGTLGAAEAGVLALITRPGAFVVPADVLERARLAMAQPVPHVREGQLLAQSGLVTAMLDVSDGLSSDLKHICEASHVGAIITESALPIDPVARDIAAVSGRDAVDFALHGGADYQLLFTVSSGDEQTVRNLLATAQGSPISVIGTITDAAGQMYVRSADGTLRPLATGGWDHLRARGANPEPGQPPRER